MSILLITKADNAYCEAVKEFVLLNFPTATVISAKRGESFPNLENWEGEYIISYLCPWVIPGWLLKRAKKASINFHPGPPEYPGIGCTNFALYNDEKVYGVTCHHMASKVDSGPIIAVKRFPILSTDTVYSLTQRAYAYLAVLFYEIVFMIINGEPLPQSSERWARRPYKRSELEALCQLTPEMSAEEIQKRVRATTFPGMPGAYIILGGLKFRYVADDK